MLGAGGFETTSADTLVKPMALPLVCPTSGSLPAG